MRSGVSRITRWWDAKAWTGGGPSPQRLAEHHEIPTAGRAKFICDESARRGGLTWAAILIEEVAEAIEAAAIYGDTSDEARSEVVQVAAVTLAMSAVHAVESTPAQWHCQPIPF